MGLGPTFIHLLMDSLESNKQIKHFLLGNNVITNSGARRIARFIQRHPNRMATWYLAGNLIKLEGLKELATALKGSPVLTNLWLKRNPLGNEAGRVLGSLVNTSASLRTLDLECCNLGDKGISILFSTLSSQPSNLQTLYISANGFGWRACTSIGDYLASPKCRLTGLYMANNRLNDDGLDFFCAGLKQNRALKRLNLASCGFSDFGLSSLADALQHHPNIMHLDIS